MVISSILLIIHYIFHIDILLLGLFTTIITDERFGNSVWRWTYDYKVIGERDFSDLDDKPFVRKRRIRNRIITFMYCNFFIGFLYFMAFLSNLLIYILS